MFIEIRLGRELSIEYSHFESPWPRHVTSRVLNTFGRIRRKSDENVARAFDFNESIIDRDVRV